MILSFILQQVFNLCRDKKVNMLVINKQIYMNVVFACTSSAVYWYITTMLDYKSMMDENQKNYIDYLVAFVLTLAWSRFFFLFLVVPSISKMILTLFTMLIDVGPFALLMLLYIILATQV